MLRDVVAQVPAESRRIKNVDGCFIPYSSAHPQGECPRKTTFAQASTLQWGYYHVTVKGTCTVTQAGRD